MEQSILTNIFQLSNKIQVEGDKLTNELTLKQWFLLLILYKGNMKNPSVNDIASVMGVTRQSIKKMISTLEKREYLSVNKSSADNRALCICPTQKAYDFFQKNKSIGLQLLKKVFDGITEDELAITFQALCKMHCNLNYTPEDDE